MLRRARRARAAAAILAALMVLGSPVGAFCSAPPDKPDPQLIAAFRTAFGVKGEVAKLSEIDATYRPYRLVRLGTAIVLLSKGEEISCQGCSAGFAIHYLKAGDRGLKVVGAWPDLILPAGHRAAPKVEVRDDLFDGPAIVARRSWAGQGCGVESADVIELTPDRPIVRAEGVRTWHADMDFSTDAWVHVLRGRIEPLARGRAFAVVYHGPRRLTVRYELGKGDAYQVAGPVKRLPGC